MTKPIPSRDAPAGHVSEDDKDMKNIQNEYLLGGKPVAAGQRPYAPTETSQAIDLIEDFVAEIESALDVAAPNPHLNMILHLLQVIPRGGWCHRRRWWQRLEFPMPQRRASLRN